MKISRITFFDILVWPFTYPLIAAFCGVGYHIYNSKTLQSLFYLQTAILTSAITILLLFNIKKGNKTTKSIRTAIASLLGVINLASIALFYFFKLFA